MDASRINMGRAAMRIGSDLLDELGDELAIEAAKLEHYRCIVIIRVDRKDRVIEVIESDGTTRSETVE